MAKLKVDCVYCGAAFNKPHLHNCPKSTGIKNRPDYGVNLRMAKRGVYLRRGRAETGLYPHVMYLVEFKPEPNTAAALHSFVNKEERWPKCPVCQNAHAQCVCGDQVMIDALIQLAL